MSYETMYNWGAAVKEWAQVAFWISGAVLCATATYRFLFA